MRHPSRTERKKREIRGRILAAAADLFDEQGVEATKVEGICERADIALRTFYNHFPTKRDVTEQLAVDATAEVAARIRSAHADGRDTRERLALFFARSADRALAAGPMHRDLLGTLVVAQVGAENLELPRHAMLALLADGRARGEVDAATPAETLADAVLGTFYRVFTDWTMVDGYPIRERLASAARFLEDAIAPPRSPR